MSEPREPSATPPVAPTSVRLVGGRYRLGPVIGRGGMATIHRARDTRLDRDVAVKLLRPEVVADADLAQRFRREALAATVLRHPNIVACLDTGTDGDQPYLIMELVDGEDLAARLRRGGRLEPWAAAHIGLDVARALGVAHVRGIVHRDIKPGNILLAGDGRAMVTDFGIARLAMDAEAALPGTTLGSVQYFSPEQARGTTTTPASDVYGLGLVLYECLTGRRAWSGATNDALALARVGAPAPSARAVRPEVPEALDAIVRRAMAAEPDGRYPNGAAMAAALEPIVATLARAARPAVAPEAGVAAAPPVEPPVEPPAGQPVPGDLPAPLRPPPAGSAAGPAPVGARSVIPAPRRRSGIGRLTALAAVVAVVVVAVLVAAMPGADGGTAAVERSASPVTTTAAPASTSQPSADPTDPAATTPTVEPTPSGVPTPEPTLRPSNGADLCESFFDLPCGLDAGRYAPSRFAPAFDIKLGKGWSAAGHTERLVVLARYQGLMTFLSGVTTVDPDGAAIPAGETSRDLIEGVVTMDGLAASEPARVRIYKKKGYSTDVSPIGNERLALFDAGGEVFYLEPGRTTRVVAMDVGGEVVVIVIEPGDDSDLDGILATADDAAATIRWR